MNALDKFWQFCSVLNDLEKSFRCDTMNTMSKQENLKCWSRSKKIQFIDISSRVKCIKHRSDDWLKIRCEAKVTASELHYTLALGTLRQQQYHYDKVILGKKKKKRDETDGT